MTLPFTFNNYLGLRRHAPKALLSTSLKLRRAGRISTLLLLIACSIPLLVTGLLDTVSLIIVRGLCGACAPDEDTDREINDNTYCCTRNLLHCIGIEKCCGMNTEIRDDSNVVYIID